MNKPVYVTIGLSGSGKSTWAKKMTGPKWFRLERDDIRRRVQGEQLGIDVVDIDWKKWDWNAGEKEVNKRWRDQLAGALDDPEVEGIIISDTHVSKSGRTKVARSLLDLGLDPACIQWVYVPTHLATCIERDAKRPIPVTERIIREQDAKLNEHPQFKLVARQA